MYETDTAGEQCNGSRTRRCKMAVWLLMLLARAQEGRLRRR